VDEVVVNERLVEVWDAFVEAARQVVREKSVTEDELHAASRFAQRLGAEGFVVGLVDMVLATAASETAAEKAKIQKANLEGPLYKAGAPIRAGGSILESQPSPDASFLTVTGRVFDVATGEGVPGAELDFWQADERGLYDMEGFDLRGVVISGDDGAYTLHTIVPGDYTTHQDDLVADFFGMMGRHAYRSAHIHLKVWVDGEQVLTTQFFDSCSPILETDVVIGAVRSDLMMERKLVGEGAGGRCCFETTFDIPVTGRSGHAGGDRAPASKVSVGSQVEEESLNSSATGG
jgi:protocatechuate 3,4-dioxygenase beta subunit